MIRHRDPSISPFTGFGDDPNTSIKFGVQVPDGRRPNWTGGEAKLSLFEIHNSDDAVTQYHGRRPREITLRLWFATLDDLEALDAVQGRSATLRHVWGVTSRAGGHQETRGDRRYLVLPDTLLVRLTDQDTPVGGQCEATATFRRTYVARTFPDIDGPYPPAPAPGSPFPPGIYGVSTYGNADYDEE